MANKTTDNRRRGRLPISENQDTAQLPIEPQLRSRPANENDPATAMMLARLRRAPSYTVFVGVFFLSLIWVFTWSYVYSDLLVAAQGAAKRTPAEQLQALIMLVVPIASMLAIAYFQWRAQQLKQVSEVLMHQAMRLIRPQDIAADGLTSIAQAVRQEVDLLVGGVEHAFQRATALEEIVHKEISAVERAFGSNEDRIRGLVQGLEGQRLALQQTSSMVNQDAQPMLSRLESNTQNLGQVVELAMQTFNRLDEGLKGSANDLARTIDDVATRASMTGQEISTHSAQFERMSTNLLGDFRSFTTQLQDHVDSLNFAAGNLGNETRKFGGEVKGMESSLLQLLQQSTSQITTANLEAGQMIERSSNEAAARVSQSHALVTQGLDQVAGDFVSKLDASRNELLTFVDKTANNVLDSVGATTSNLVRELETTLGHANQQMQLTGNSVNDILASTTDNLLATVGATTSNLARELETTLGRANQQMQLTGNSVNDILVSTSGTIAAHLKDTSEIVSRQMQDSGLALAQNIENSGGLVTERLISVSGDFVQKLSSTNSELMNNILQSTNLLETRFETMSSEIANRVESLSTDTIAHLETVTNRVNQQLTSTAGNLTEQVSSATQDLTTRLDQSSTKLGTLLGATEQRLGNQLEQATTEFTALFDVNTRMMIDQLDQSAGKITNAFAETAVTTTQHLNASSEAVTNKVDQASKNMFERLNATTLHLGQRFDQATIHLESVTGEISKRMDGQGQRFAEVLNTASGQIFADLGKARDAFSEGLGETAMQITGRFEQETGLIVGRIDNAITAFDEAATTSGTRLDDASKKFAKHIETANTYLADQLASAAGDIDGKLETISMQLTGRLEMTGSRISDRLEDVSSLVEKSINKFNSEMENMLASRRDALDQLVADANHRANQVDQGMASYMTLIEESLNTAEQRAQNINRIVAEQTTQALGRLEEELRKLESNSSSQVSQAARALREQHERALASMNEMLSSTASDFQQTAQDMRITAQQVVKDIDSARNELKRAVIDLPEETRINADNMRKVVADQISALNALSDVVRRQSGALDFSGPGFVMPRSPQGSGGSNPGKSEGASFLSPVSGSMSARSTTADRAAASRKVQATAVPEPLATADLGREVEAYSSKLNAAARDVVEALEGSLPRDLEKRYAASDKAVYTQRLYESRSRKMTKTIEGRYADERLLRSRVQAYNRLFEKLLDTLSDTKGGDQVMEQVLASEQGRIYVMLAEAAGRLPSQN